jgi:type IV secretion system protein VirD4
MSTTTITLLAGAVLALGMSVFEWRRRDRVTAVLLVTAALTLTSLASLALAVGVLLCGGAGMWNRRGHAAAVVTRWGRRSSKKHGVAATWDIVRVASWVAMRRKATTVRPSLADLTRRQRVRVGTGQVAVPLCRAGLMRVWASVEDVICVFGRPRSGKSGWLAHHIIDAPGAVLVTSTRTDLHDLTAGLRAARGPVAVFNPTGLGDLPTTVTFDPLSGCANPVTAHERATDLLSGAARAGVGDREYWEGQARRVLTALLHAAALGALGMPDVLRWVANPDAAARQVLSLLRRSSSAGSYVPDAEQFLTTNDKTRSSITSTIMPALGWLANPTACAAATRAAPLDVARWLRSRGTIYLLGAEESQVAPLVAALTGHIAREGRRIAARAPSGRLDPPLTLVLDECALIAPVPLDSWTSDMGGRGVQIIAAFQSRAQLVTRWGEAAARVILNNTGATVLFSYGGDTDDLAHWSRLAGDRDELHTTHDPQGRVTSRTTRKVPVITPTQLTTLPRRRVVVFRHGMPVVVGRVQMAWSRRDVKAQAKAVRVTARTVVTTAEQLAHAAHPVSTPMAEGSSGRLPRWVPTGGTRRRSTRLVSEPSPTPEPLAADRWVVDTHGTTQPLNGTHPVGDAPPP